MAQPSLSVRDDPGLGPGGKRFVLSCQHGATSAALLGGRRALPDLVVLDILIVRHDRLSGCRCSHDLRPRIAEAARA